MIFSGVGFLVPVIGMFSLIGTDYLAKIIYGGNLPIAHKSWMAFVAMLVAAAVTYGLHLLLLREKARVVIDKATGQEITLRSSHSLFFVPVKWWSAFFVILGVAFIFN